ncbi:hypothetical protein [Lactobacillus sp. ESL0228]|uniref:hypothetical protein n=1 Tax=Lactobacillus sp. ESL0228 TaxID=2069352 RepID=UPI000EFC115A|nr:hypothetical protein [Lactobacillus sp. ESL0228]RMC48887.1 hypothetical protein F5ESL0228_04625 [Lactobacillus sp. ESL0228]
MNPLENFLSNDADPKLAGFLSNSVKRGYNEFQELIAREPELQLQAARNAYGYLRHVYIDILLKHDAKTSGIDLNFFTKQVSKNGYTYLAIKHRNCIITVHKTNSEKDLPVKAKNRTLRSEQNKNIVPIETSLFEENISQDKSYNMYIMVTYGGKNYTLDYIQLGIPNPGVTSWLYTKDITDALTIVPPVTASEKQDIELEFRSEVKQLLKKEKEDNGGKIQS